MLEHLARSQPHRAIRTEICSPRSSESARKKVGIGAKMPGVRGLEVVEWLAPLVPLVPLITLTGMVMYERGRRIRYFHSMTESNYLKPRRMSCGLTGPAAASLSGWRDDGAARLRAELCFVHDLFARVPEASVISSKRTQVEATRGYK